MSVEYLIRDDMPVSIPWCPVCRHLDFFADGPGMPSDFSQTSLYQMQQGHSINLHRHADRSFQMTAELSKCPFCRLLCEVWKASPDWIPDTDASGLNLVPTANFSTVTVEFFQLKARAFKKTHIEFAGLPRRWDIGGPSEFKHVPANAASDHCWKFVFDVFQDCTTSHEECRKPPQPLPKRVLFLGDDTSKAELQEPGDLHAPYVALSHCWGTSKPLNTTTATLEQHKKGVKYNDLPLCFRDAVTCTKRLGFEYLWIDSLCIIQDDRDDWLAHTYSMAAIYENAELIIATSSSPSTECSFLAMRDQKYYNEAEFNLNIDAERILPVSVRNIPTHTENDGPLDSRAWAYQEQFLARRRISFGKDEITYRCKRLSRCECKHRDVVVPLPHSHYSWLETISNYSARHLTFETDKLPALSGVVIALQNLGKREYLAGLWKEDMINSLAWFEMSYAESTTSKAYIAPTFSWLSVRTQVFPRYYFDSSAAWIGHPRFLPRFLEGQCDADTVNPYGQVSGGFIVLQAQVIDCFVSRSNRTIPYAFYPQHQKALCRLGFYNDSSLGEGYAASTTSAGASTTRTVRRLVEGETPRDEEHDLPAIALSLAESPNEMDRFVLLLALSTRVPGAYERIGSFGAGDYTGQGANQGVILYAWFQNATERVVKIV